MTLWLAQLACRDLPEPTRSDSLAEWSAELYAILDERPVHPLRRWWRAVLYAGDLWRGAWRRLPARARVRVAAHWSASALKTAATGVAVGLPLKALLESNFGGPVTGLSLWGPTDGPVMQPGDSLLGGGAFAGWFGFVIGFTTGCVACRIGGGRTLRDPTLGSGFLNRYVTGPVLIAAAGFCCAMVCTVVTFVIGIFAVNGAGVPSGVILLVVSCSGAVLAACLRRLAREDVPTAPAAAREASLVRHDTGVRG
ncbi:hypothetical protein ACFWXK_13885 [Streptomyces sp. NPDC059070]|uniref:hypothetical protein n=1 Tax=Streptomyces sp. NPDC059070 TaxID=3346713 RepID=UPI0036BA9E3F